MRFFKKSRPFIPILLFVVSLSHLQADPVYPGRVVSLSPSITETIYALGAWDKVVGVTIYSDFPPEAEKMQKVGGWVNPNLEMIVKLQPDLVIMLTDQDKIFGDKLRALGLKTLQVDSNPSIAHINESIITIGKALGKQAQSIRLKGQIEAEVIRIKKILSKQKPRTVLCVIGRNPGTLEDIYVVGNTSYINELISVSGGVNVIKKKKTALKISKEAIFSLDPDIIIEINHDKTDNEKEVKQIWAALSESRAIKMGRISVISSSAILHPSHRIIEGLKELIKIINPEAASLS